MKRSAFVKLLGRGSGVTSSCLAFEFVVTVFLLDQMCPFDWVSGCIAISSAAPHIHLVLALRDLSCPMPALNIVVFGMGTNFGWQGDICKYATCGDSQACYY